MSPRSRDTTSRPTPGWASEGSESGDGVEPGRGGPPPRTVLAIASLGAAVAFVDATIVNIAFPDIAQSYPDTPIASLSWVLNGYTVLFAA